MAKTKTNANVNANNTIDALLQQRAQYEQWLARLDATADQAPATVRHRVRGDYEGRLSRVIDELRSHAATIAEELEQHRAEQSRLDAERQTAEETLAEAEIRHVVGEYTEDEWQRLSGESQRHLDGLRGELQGVGVEIARLAEVQTLIESPSRVPELEPVAAVAPVARNTPAPVPVSVTTVSAQVSMPLEAVMSIPAARQPEPAPAVAELVMADPSDELAFLRSVADDEQKPAVTPSRRSSNSGAGASAKAVAEPVATATVAAPTPSIPPAAPPAATSGAGASKAGMAKTLKCSECGTFNRPTEWYCERCGAELAAL